MLVDEAGAELRVAAAVGAEPLPSSMDRVAVGGGVAGRVFASGEAIVVERSRRRRPVRGARAARALPLALVRGGADSRDPARARRAVRHRPRRRGARSARTISRCCRSSRVTSGQLLAEPAASVAASAADAQTLAAPGGSAALRAWRSRTRTPTPSSRARSATCSPSRSSRSACWTRRCGRWRARCRPRRCRSI